MTELEKINQIGVELPLELYRLLPRDGNLNATSQDIFDVLDADADSPLSKFKEWVFENIKDIWMTEHLRRALLEW